MNALKSIMFGVLLFSITNACSKGKGTGSDSETGPAAHYVTGRVLDETGKPVKDVKVIIDILNGSWGEAITTTSDENGNYKAALGAGGLYQVSYGEITRTLEGRTFKMRVHSDNREAFNYDKGAVRNLTWKLSGPTEPNSTDYYGGSVLTYYVNGNVDYNYITFKFEPVILIDGSKPAPFTKKTTNGSYIITDVPIGKYKITGTYQAGPNAPVYSLDFREAINPNGSFSTNGIIATFYPGPDPVNCTNCLKLDFQ